MSAVGETRRCPHCREQVLASASICPGCQRRLRVGAGDPGGPLGPAVCPLSVEALIRPQGVGGGWEYTVLVEIQDLQGEVVARRVVGVGAMQPGEARKIAVRVEVRIPENGDHPAPQ